MNNKIVLIAALAAASFAQVGCNKDKINPNEKGSIGLHFDNRAGNMDLALNNAQGYNTPLNQQITISTFDYYISNIQLTNKDGGVVTLAQSYHLVKESDTESQEFNLNDIPEGDYQSITFLVGVDSARSTMPIADRTGVLDPAGEGAGMYWSWNSGYIFVKLEGTSPQAPLDTATNTRPLYYHVGGFGGYSSATINNLRTITLPFGSDVEVRKDGEVSKLHINVDALKVITGTTNVDFSTNPVSHFGTFSGNLANNYTQMFVLDHIH